MTAKSSPVHSLTLSSPSSCSPHSDSGRSSPVHSLTLSSHRFLGLPRLLASLAVTSVQDCYLHRPNTYYSNSTATIAPTATLLHATQTYFSSSEIGLSLKTQLEISSGRILWWSNTMHTAYKTSFWVPVWVFSCVSLYRPQPSTPPLSPQLDTNERA